MKASYPMALPRRIADKNQSGLICTTSRDPLTRGANGDSVSLVVDRWEQAAACQDWMVAHRRALHEEPEVGLDLPDTHAYRGPEVVRRLLRRMGPGGRRPNPC